MDIAHALVFEQVFAGRVVEQLQVGRYKAQQGVGLYQQLHGGLALEAAIAHLLDAELETGELASHRKMEGHRLARHHLGQHRLHEVVKAGVGSGNAIDFHRCTLLFLALACHLEHLDGSLVAGNAFGIALTQEVETESRHKVIAAVVERLFADESAFRREVADETGDLLAAFKLGLVHFGVEVFAGLQVVGIAIEGVAIGGEAGLAQGEQGGGGEQKADHGLSRYREEASGGTS